MLTLTRTFTESAPGALPKLRGMIWLLVFEKSIPLQRVVNAVQ